MKNRLPFPILFENRDVIVIDKPAGMLTTHTRAKEMNTVEEWLNDYIRKGQRKSHNHIWLVHRLDRETSGVMMVAKSEEVAESFRADWSNLTKKTYIARVNGILPQDEGVYESFLRDDPKTMKVKSVKSEAYGKLARTEWKKLSTQEGTTLVEIHLKSGRKNQIRVHFSEAGYPIIGDEKYGGIKASRMYLDAMRLEFRNPQDGKWIKVEHECSLL